MMSLAIVYSRAQVGIEALPVTIEVHITQGLPNLSIVGLPEAAVKESMIVLAGYLPQEAVENTIVVGELSLDGIVRHTRGGAGHFGFLIVDTAAGAPPGRNNVPGCLSALASGPALHLAGRDHRHEA